MTVPTVTSPASRACIFSRTFFVMKASNLRTSRSLFVTTYAATTATMVASTRRIFSHGSSAQNRATRESHLTSARG